MQLYVKIKEPSQKTDERSKQKFLQKQHTDGQKVIEMFLNITNRNASQNYNERPPHISQNGRYQKV